MRKILLLQFVIFSVINSITGQVNFADCTNGCEQQLESGKVAEPSSTDDKIDLGIRFAYSKGSISYSREFPNQYNFLEYYEYETGNEKIVIDYNIKKGELYDEQNHIDVYHADDNYTTPILSRKIRRRMARRDGGGSDSDRNRGDFEVQILAHSDKSPSYHDEDLGENGWQKLYLYPGLYFIKFHISFEYANNTYHRYKSVWLCVKSNLNLPNLKSIEAKPICNTNVYQISHELDGCYYGYGYGNLNLKYEYDNFDGNGYRTLRDQGVSKEYSFDYIFNNNGYINIRLIAENKFINESKILGKFCIEKNLETPVISNYNLTLQDFSQIRKYDDENNKAWLCPNQEARLYIENSEDLDGEYEYFYRWYKNGEPIPYKYRNYLEISGDGSGQVDIYHFEKVNQMKPRNNNDMCHGIQVIEETVPDEEGWVKCESGLNFKPFIIENYTSRNARFNIVGNQSEFLVGEEIEIDFEECIGESEILTILLGSETILTLSENTNCTNIIELSLNKVGENNLIANFYNTENGCVNGVYELPIIVKKPLCEALVPYDPNGTATFTRDVFSGKIVYRKEQDCPAEELFGCISTQPDNTNNTLEDNVVSISAITLNDNWQYTNGASTGNTYEKGEKGLWRAESTWAYKTNEVDYTNPKSGGTFKAQPFNYKYPSGNGPDWVKASKVTKYSPHGEPLEEVDALGIASSTRFGYHQSLPVLVAKNASQDAVYFESFEVNYQTISGNGPLFENGFNPWYGVQSTDVSHGGKSSLRLSHKTYQSFDFDLGSFSSEGFNNNTTVLFSFWLYPTKEMTVVEVEQSLNFKDITNNISTSKKIIKVGNWYKVEFAFNAPNSTFRPGFVFYTNEAFYIDDVRLQPSEASMACYVYDPETLRLLATFDDQHFGLYYEYDAQGRLTRKKIETERGIQTIQENYQHTVTTQRNQ